jgi:hypothetical protein
MKEKKDEWTLSEKELLEFIAEAEEYSDVASRQKKKRRIVVNVADWMWRALKNESRRINAPINAIVRAAILDYLRQKKNK